jgi:hypothetical protein
MICEVAVQYESICDGLDSIGFSQPLSSGDYVSEQQRGEQNRADQMTARARKLYNLRVSRAPGRDAMMVAWASRNSRGVIRGRSGPIGRN